MSIFPSYKEQLEQQNEATTLPIAEDIQLNENGMPIVDESGDYVIVTKNEAIETWCYFALRTAKNVFLAFSSSYGQTFEELINNVDFESLLNAKVKECLLQSRYIKSVDSVTYELTDDEKLSLNISYTTIYGSTGGKYIV